MSSRLPFLLFAIANLLVGLFAGLVRIGWRWDVPNVSSTHGAIMVGGFLGTLILLEKAIPLKKKYLLALAAINGSSVVFILAGLQTPALCCLLIGASGLILTLILYLRNHPSDLPLIVMLCGSVFLLTGHVLLLTTGLYPMALPWWIAFIVFTITGERLELSKFLPVDIKSKKSLLVFLGVFVIGLLTPYHAFGRYISGGAIVLIATWLMRFDIVTIGLKKEGLIKFSSIALLMGYCGLLLTGVFMISLAEIAFGYDIIVHTFFLGFTFSMIFAHGPIILPGVLGLNVRPYHPAFFIPLILLWMSLVVRILADLFWIPFEARLISGWLTGAGILLYFLVLISTLIASRRA